MGLSTPTSHYDILRLYEQEYDAGITAGTTLPFVYPIGSYAAALLLVFLLVPPTYHPLYIYGRLTTFMIICCSSIYTVCYCKCRTPSVGFGVGLVSAWLLIWSATLLIFTDAKRDFKRLQKIQRLSAAHTLVSGTSSSNSYSASKSNGAISSLRERNKALNDKATPKTSSSAGSYFVWQPWPSNSFVERLDWTIDLFCNCRGVGWNWMIPCLPPFPQSVRSQLGQRADGDAGADDEPVSRSGIKRWEFKEEVIRHNIIKLVRGYVLLDLLKTIMNHDPYFWGLTNAPPPSYFPEILRTSSAILRGYRLVVVLMAVGTFLSSFFSLSAPLFVGILGTDLIGARGEPWYYPDSWGSYSNVLNYGLAGWWGGWWHQTFRYAFQAGGRWAVAKLRVPPKSQMGKLTQLIVAFGLSGMLHASGSMTLLGQSRPLSRAFLFFALQPIGIMVQMYLAKGLGECGITGRMPLRIRQACNFIFVHLWFYFTGPLICDDWAKGGILLFEPVPFSLFRGLGFGVKGDRFWCLNGSWVYWYRGKYWWSSGITF